MEAFRKSKKEEDEEEGEGGGGICIRFVAQKISDLKKKISRWFSLFSPPASSGKINFLLSGFFFTFPSIGARISEFLCLHLSFFGLGLGEFVFFDLPPPFLFMLKRGGEMSSLCVIRQSH